MPGLYSRLKVWIAGETLTAADQNAEFDNVIANFEPDKLDDYSANVAQMQSTADPGEVGSESLATSTAGELERLRFAIAEVKGTDEWYESPSTNLASIVSSSAASENRIVSAATRGSSNQPLFLSPDGTLNEATIYATATNLAVSINNSLVTFVSDITLTGLPLAPAATALVNDTNLTGQANSKLIGEGNTNLAIDTVGAAITSRVGDWAPFKINNGVDDEYFFAYVDSNAGIPQFTHCFRGWFFDDADAPVERITISNNDTITLLQAAWIFLNNDGLTAAIASSTPYFSGVEPSAAINGDYWLDLVEKKWKVKIGGSFTDANQVLIGITVQDTTKCIAARSFDFSHVFNNENNITLTIEGDNEIRSNSKGSDINVYGSLLNFEYDLLQWLMPSSLDSGVSENASTTYYLYVKDSGSSVISNVAPHIRKDLKGFYHTHNPWRCVGKIENDASSNFINVASLGPREDSFIPIHSNNASSTFSTTATVVATVKIESFDGGPIMLGLNSRSATESSINAINATGSATVRLDVVIKRNGIAIANNRYGHTMDTTTNNQTYFGGSPIYIDFNPGVGTITYELQTDVITGPTAASSISNLDFYALKL